VHAETGLRVQIDFLLGVLDRRDKARYHVTIRRDPELLICESQAETKGN
jgi:hypothetical protein